MSSMFEAVHFDMDGVLADTEPLHVAAEQQTCRDFDFDINPASWGGFKGMTAQAIFQHLLEKYGDPETQTVGELIAHKTNLFLDNAKTDLEPIDGALDFLQWARDSHDKIALVTSSNRRVQECIIGSFGIGSYFDSIITGDDITNGKPDPEPYLKSLKETDAQPESSLVIEDSKSGIRSALAAKCSVLALTTSYSAEELRQVNPTFISTYSNARNVLGY